MNYYYNYFTKIKILEIQKIIVDLYRYNVYYILNFYSILYNN